MPDFATKYNYFRDRNFTRSYILSFFFLCVSLVVNFYSGIYATRNASNPVTDIVLSNTKAFDLDGVFIYGTLFLWILVTCICLLLPHKVPFVLKSIALFVIVRSLFVSLTHIGPFPTQIIIDSKIISKFSFGGDLFFSGHVGLPFLLALIFWDNVRLRFIFLATSIFFAVVVLFAHLHYSIDVVSAFFITYTIYHIAELAFPKDQKIFRLD